MFDMSNQRTNERTDGRTDGRTTAEFCECLLSENMLEALIELAHQTKNKQPKVNQSQIFVFFD
jgi:hypothetical protein